MPNIANIMKQRNEQLLREESDMAEERLCNCENTNTCPLNGECLTPSLVYTANVRYTEENLPKLAMYHGSTAGPFKTRWSEHNSSFRLSSTKERIQPYQNLFGA